MSEGVGQPIQVPVSFRIVEPGEFTQAIRQHLLEVTGSPAFKGSRRGQQFLQHVVEAALDGQLEKLKERSLGVDLFSRTASYDTGEDAIVRVTASDVRKRLHQFYSETSFDLRIDLPSGSYTPEFRRAAPSAPQSAPVSAPSAVRRYPITARDAGVFLLAVMTAGAGIWLWLEQRAQARPSLKNVVPWSLLLQRDRPTHVVLSDSNMSAIQVLLGFQISLSDYANRRYWPDSPPLEAGLRRAIQSLRGVDVPSVDVGIVLEIARLAPPSPPLKTHTARSLQLADFKTDDGFILLGSPRSNPWGSLFQDQLNFEFAFDESLNQEIIRNKHPQSGELPAYVPTAKGWDTGRAFALVAFVGNPGHAGHVLLLSGTNAEGTEAAGKLATDLEQLSRVLLKCGIEPTGPPRHFEILLQVRTMAGSPTTFEVLACHPLPKPAQP